MKYYIVLLIALSGLFSCNHPDPAKRHQAMLARVDSLKHELLQTDIAFSQLSEQKGRNAAFLEYAADNATLLRPFSMPVTGKDSIVNLFKDHPDSSYTLTWIPVHSDVARSGDIGYTYGTYTLDIKNIGKEEGTYCTVWKRQKGHSWKFVLDTGNEGLKAVEKAADQLMDAKETKEEKKETKKKK